MNWKIFFKSVKGKIIILLLLALIGWLFGEFSCAANLIGRLKMGDAAVEGLSSTCYPWSYALIAFIGGSVIMFAIRRKLRNKKALKNLKKDNKSLKSIHFKIPTNK